MLNLATTRGVIERLSMDRALKRLCGFPMWKPVPDEATFSRAFAQFTQARLPERVHVPLSDHNRRGGAKDEFEPPDAVRYKERTQAERTNGRLKDEFGGRSVRARGPDKVMTHLMFGLLVLTADQLMRLLT